jgi:hypothetical protein
MWQKINVGMIDMLIAALVPTKAYVIAIVMYEWSRTDVS